MERAIVVKQGVEIPASAIEMRTSRSSGPGGQNVNKVSSKVDLRVDLACIVGLRADARARLAVACRNRLDADGRLQVISQLTRDQPRNLDDATEKVRQLVLQAMIAPKPRRKTKPSRGAVLTRLDDKRRQAVKKQRRRGSNDD